ncbi:unnamed protein product [Prorocentrum cordatum]|uniref:FAD/NAD(P)-binding domain-containing protein n=1 Tax=Prorocentrum cordatum TaxID=2364126 RepID=A0ABN9QPW2_9DINO|nr:unnamed protein product [Polarella glacialis]
MAAAHGESPGRARRALVVGGGAAGLAAARGLWPSFSGVAFPEYFEFTPGVLRAYADPARWEALTFLYHEVLERHLGVRWIWGEVTAIDGDECCAHVLAAFSRESETIPRGADSGRVTERCYIHQACPLGESYRVIAASAGGMSTNSPADLRKLMSLPFSLPPIPYDFCVLAGGCHSNAAAGGSPWSPAVHARVRDAEQSGLDERYLEGRRRRVVEEHQHLASLQQRRGSVLIVGAGYTGVEFACELQHHLPGLCITVADSMERCLEPLPEQAASYCEGYMRRVGIRTVYGHDLRYDPKDRAFWTRVGLPEGADRTYVLSGVRSSAYFMPKETLSDRGPGGGGWILTNRSLQVVTRKGVRWGRGVVFAAGDCAASSAAATGSG